MKEVLKELNVEKLNICEADGTIKLSLFNSNNIPPLLIDGEDLLPGHRQDDGISGLMFYNTEGDECGGLIYGSNIDENGKVSMGMSLTFDQYKQDQVLQLLLAQEGEHRQYGINIFDRPENHIKESLEYLKKYNVEENPELKQEYLKKLQENNQKRMFFGKDFDGEPKVIMYDKEGKEKIKISLEEGDPSIIINGKKLPLDKLLRLK